MERSQEKGQSFDSPEAAYERRELWPTGSLWLKPGLIPQGVWRLGIEDSFLEGYELSKW